MQIDSHAPGSFCWFELATVDQDGAKEFYGNLFGWGMTDQPIGPDETYTIFTINDRQVAAAYSMRPEERSQGAPPHWTIYIAVTNADEAAAKITAAGGTVIAPPFDVADHGRMAVVSDPTGAMFAVWQSKAHIGTGLTGVNGTVVWADLNTPDPARAGKFYSDVFGWKIVEGKDMVAAGPDSYGHIVNGESFMGGIPPAAHFPAGAPPHWLIYFAAPDCDGALSETVAEHGRVLMKTHTMEGQRKFAVLADPQGAAFAVVQELK